MSLIAHRHAKRRYHKMNQESERHNGNNAEPLLKVEMKPNASLRVVAVVQRAVDIRAVVNVHHGAGKRIERHTHNDNDTKYAHDRLKNDLRVQIETGERHDNDAVDDETERIGVPAAAIRMKFVEIVLAVALFENFARKRNFRRPRTRRQRAVDP